MPDAFFLPLGDDRYRATTHTTGPWAPGAQHGGPPSALLARALEATAPRDDALLCRITVEILGAVPVDELTVSSRVLRPGRNVELLEASLHAGGREAARATGWRVTRADVDVPTVLSNPPPLDPAAAEPPGQDDGWVPGFLQAMEWRGAEVFRSAGPAVAWARMRVPLVDGEEASSIARTMVLADCGNGLSAALSPREHVFINPELTVHLHRAGEGEWRCLDAATTVTSGGVGLATSVLSDRRGPIGVGAQSLLVAARP